MTPNKIFLLLLMAMYYYIAQSIALFFSRSLSTASSSVVLELPLPQFICSIITHSFKSGPIMSRTLS